MGTSGSLKIVRMPASYIISQSGHGKWGKNGFFSHFDQLLRCKFFEMKADIQDFLKMAAQSQRSLKLTNVSKNKRRQKKYMATILHFRFWH